MAPRAATPLGPRCCTTGCGWAGAAGPDQSGVAGRAGMAVDRTATACLGAADPLVHRLVGARPSHVGTIRALPGPWGGGGGCVVFPPLAHPPVAPQHAAELLHQSHGR